MHWAQSKGEVQQPSANMAAVSAGEGNLVQKGHLHENESS